MTHLHTFNGITVRQLKEYVKDLPEEDENGEDYEVWIESGDGLSSQAKSIFPLNKRDNPGFDIIIEHSC